jgi:hypothetical protein
MVAGLPVSVLALVEEFACEGAPERGCAAGDLYEVSRGGLRIVEQLDGTSMPTLPASLPATCRRINRR